MKNIFKALFDSKSNKAERFNSKYASPYTKKDMESGKMYPNLILSSNLRLSLTRENITPGHQKNGNVLVLGGAGSGKSHSYLLPNIMKCSSSFICNDPTGETLRQSMQVLLSHGYEVKVFSVDDMNNSVHFNPLDYIYEADGSVSPLKVRSLVDVMIKSFATHSSHPYIDPFHDKALNCILFACIFYLAEFCEPEKRNLYNVMRLIKAGILNMDTGLSELDKLFERVRSIDKTAKCLISYDTFKLAPAKTANSVLITLSSGLQDLAVNESFRDITTTNYLQVKKGHGPDSATNNKNVKDGRQENNKNILTVENEDYEYVKDGDGIPHKGPNNIDFSKMGRERTALFVCGNHCGLSHNFITDVLFNVAFMELVGHQRHAIPINMYLDEFANIVHGDLPYWLAMARSSNVNVSMILQSKSQLDKMCERDPGKADCIIGNCDTIIYLGSSEYETSRYISEMVGKTAIRCKDIPEKNRKTGSETERYILEPAEVARLSTDDCIVLLRGEKAMIDKKYGLQTPTSHKEK